MQKMTTFDPKWAVPPGSTVLDLLQERGESISNFAVTAEIDEARFARLLFGVEHLTEDWAKKLAQTLGASPEFWLRREEHYRADLERLCNSNVPENSNFWLRDLPINDMVRYGWIESGASRHETALNACAFFGVATEESFERKYKNLLTAYAYRTSAAFTPRPSAVAAWLRQGEIAAAAIDCRTWSDGALKQALEEIKALTREKEPMVFLPKLEHIFSTCGVAMVIARTPEGCRASGATRFLNDQKALIQLSFRYLSDDQFWFTVFHEIGHLLLHANHELFREGLEDRNSKAEQEADQFALEILFSKVGIDSLNSSVQSRFEIARLARKAGIAPGIVVGCLQKNGHIPFNHFNYLKNRFTWQETDS